MESGVGQCQVMGHERRSHRSRSEGEPLTPTYVYVTDIPKVFGPDATANPVEYYLNPVGIQSVIFSAAELGP